MISIKKTILATIEDKVKKMRYLGQYDPKAFKKIMSLIVINFIYDWVYFNDRLSEYLQQLRDLQTGIIINDCTFKLVNKAMFDDGNIVESQLPYRNVNTPQSNDDWKRVWDAPEISIIRNGEEITAPEPWTPDDSCTPIVVYFDKYKLDGTPDLDVTKFTTCDKMNIYINRFDNSAYYLNYNGEWVKLTNNEGVTEARVNELIQENKLGITSTISDKTKIVKLSDNASDYVESELITVDDINAIL